MTRRLRLGLLFLMDNHTPSNTLLLLAEAAAVRWVEVVALAAIARLLVEKALVVGPLLSRL